jgi:hypothetical protein
MMTLEEIVEQLAFGKTALKLNSCLGLYLSPETIYIAETHLDRAGRLSVDHLIRVPVPPMEEKDKAAGSALGGLNTGFLTQNSKLTAIIRQSMSQIHWKSKYVMVTLSHHLGLLRYFTMPAIDRRFWRTAIPVEAKKYIPIPFEALNYDFQCIHLPPDANNRPRQGTLIAVTQRQNLANIATMLHELGLTVAGMEVAPCSVLKLWQTLGKGNQSTPFCQVHFDGGNVRILISDKGFPVFFREVFLGEEANIADQRKVDLGGCVAFAQKQLAVGGIGRVWVSGGSPNISVWKDSFSRELGMPVNIQETSSMLGIKGGDWGGYSAIGASLKFQSSSAIALDLGAVGRVTDEERRVARDVLAVGAAAALLTLLMGLWSLAAYHFKARQFAALKRDTALEEVFRGKSDEAVQDMFKKMREQADVASIFSNTRDGKVIALLKDVVSSLPDKAWLKQVTITRPLRKSSITSSNLLMTGNVAAETTSQEQDLVFQFRDRLAKCAAFMKAFPELKVTVQAQPSDGQPQALNPESFAHAQEGRTNFIVLGTEKTRPIQ